MDKNRALEMGRNSSMTGPKESVGQEITPVVRALQQGLGKKLVAVVLFGSRARGDAKEESDWDMLVIAKDLPKRQIERYRKTKEILPSKWRGRISILAKTPDEFESVLPSLYLEIALDGLILYDPKEYAAVQLQKLRRLIQAKDLRRERRGRDFIWKWGTFPGFGWSLSWKEAS
jgi:predicted nucleotidyltransferase